MVAVAEGAWVHQRAAEPRGRAASLRAPVAWDGESEQKKMEARNFWRLKNFKPRNKSPFPLTGLDKITLFAFSLTHCKNDLLDDTVWTGGGTHHPTVCLHAGEGQAQPDPLPSFCTARNVA